MHYLKSVRIAWNNAGNTSGHVVGGTTCRNSLAINKKTMCCEVVIQAETIKKAEMVEMDFFWTWVLHEIDVRVILSHSVEAWNERGFRDFHNSICFNLGHIFHDSIPCSVRDLCMSFIFRGACEISCTCVKQKSIPVRRKVTPGWDLPGFVCGMPYVLLEL